MAIDRVVIPEWLDALAADDPKARRSRRDLRLINALMGNTAWVRRTVAKFPHVAKRGITEIGAGEGMLCEKLASAFPGTRVTGMDFAPAPSAAKFHWRQGDFFQCLDEIEGGVLAGVMILHHFGDDRLRRLAGTLEKFDMLCFCEPWRAAWPQFLGTLMFPLVGPVTRHDMPVSIRAGFRAGELAALWNLPGWRIKESVDWRGSVRFVAWKE